MWDDIFTELLYSNHVTTVSVQWVLYYPILYRVFQLDVSFWIARYFGSCYNTRCHFHFGGYVNKQNCRIWVLIFLKMKLERLFRYMDYAIEPWLMNFYGQNWKIWMRTIFISNRTVLRATQVSKPSIFCVKFSDRVISRIGDYNYWPPRSCDLTPLDFFLWCYVKDKVYADAPQLIQELKEKIRAVIDEIEPRMCENVMKNFIKRAWSCKGPWPHGHMNDIVFHYQWQTFCYWMN